MPLVLVLLVQRAGTEGGEQTRLRAAEAKGKRPQRAALPDGDGLGEGAAAGVVVLVLGPVVQGAREGVQAAVVVQRLRRQLRLPATAAAAQHAGGLAQELALHLRLVRQQVVVELGALELSLEGPRCAGVRLGDVAVVAGGGRQRFGGRCVGAVDRRFVGETP